VGFFEASDGLADGIPQFRQPPRTEEQQGNDQDNQQGGKIIPEHSVASRLLNNFY
jgi:hypothetical protein